MPFHLIMYDWLYIFCLFNVFFGNHWWPSPHAEGVTQPTACVVSSLKLLYMQCYRGTVPVFLSLCIRRRSSMATVPGMFHYKSRNCVDRLFHNDLTCRVWKTNSQPHRRYMVSPNVKTLHEVVLIHPVPPKVSRTLWISEGLGHFHKDRVSQYYLM